MIERNFDAIRSWMIAAEALGEYIGIRFGRIGRGQETPEWIFLTHAEYDGIGGFADLLRRRGAALDQLIQIKHPASPSMFAVVRTLPRFLSPRQRLRWAKVEGVSPSGGEPNGGSNGGTPHNGSNVGPPQAVSWDVFDKPMTISIRHACRKAGVTVNSFLLKHLTKAIRPFLADQSAEVPWMVPVNMRGKVMRQLDTANHSSYVTVRINSYETVQDVHRRIYGALGRGEHWANWYSYQSARFLNSGLQRFLIARELATPSWHLGGFSNIGDWDPDEKLSSPEILGDWLFCPPVLRFQGVGAGCVTFQNRLTVTLQIHPALSTDPTLAKRWAAAWRREIEMDLDHVRT